MIERHRCTKCRNPIRGGGVVRPGPDADQWYHPDCWQEICSFEQTRYEQQVESAGLSALLAPYICSSPAGIGAPSPSLREAERPRV